LTGTGHQLEDREITVDREIIVATTSEDRGTTTATRTIILASKETPLLQEIHQMPASNVERKDTTPGIAQNAAQTTNIVEQPI